MNSTRKKGASNQALLEIKQAQLERKHAPQGSQPANQFRVNLSSNFSPNGIKFVAASGE